MAELSSLSTPNNQHHSHDMYGWLSHVTAKHIPLLVFHPTLQQCIDASGDRLLCLIRLHWVNEHALLMRLSRLPESRYTSPTPLETLDQKPCASSSFPPDNTTAMPSQWPPSSSHPGPFPPSFTWVSPRQRPPPPQPVPSSLVLPPMGDNEEVSPPAEFGRRDWLQDLFHDEKSRSSSDLTSSSTTTGGQQPVNPPQHQFYECIVMPPPQYESHSSGALGGDEHEEDEDDHQSP